MVTLCIAFVGALVLVIQHRPLLFPAIALVASGIELLNALHAIHLSLGRISLTLVLGIALAVAGAAVYLRSSAKPVVAAATAVALIGLMQTLAALRI